MDLLKTYGPEGVIAFLIGIIFAEWVGSDSSDGAYVLLLVIASAVAAMIIRLLRKLTGW